MKKRSCLPILLSAWPYFVVVLLYLVAIINNQYYGFIVLGTVALTAAVYISNIVNACTYKNQNDDVQLAFWNMLIKLIHIPFYLGVFLLGVLFLLAMVVPAFVFLSPMLMVILAVIDFFLMITSSVYGINAIVRAKQKGKVSTAFMVVNIILHLFFVTDLISAIIVYVKLKSA